MGFFINLGSFITYFLSYKLTNLSLKVFFFIVISNLLFGYLAGASTVLMGYLEDLLPLNIFSILVYFGMVDFFRVFLSLSVQAVLLKYFFDYFTYNTPST